MPDLDESTVVAEIAPLTPTPAAQVPADDFDKDRAMDTIRKQREELKAAKAKVARLAELEAAEQERASAELSESDKLKAELAKVQARADATAARLNAELVKSAAQSAALALQTPFASADALVDAVALGAFATLEIGDDGKVEGINDAIKALHKARPYLFGQAQAQAPDINAGARGAGSQSKQDIDNANRQRLLQRGGRY